MGRRYKGYVARHLINKHTYTDAPSTETQLLELTQDEGALLAERMKDIKLCYEHEKQVVDVGKVISASVEQQSDGSKALLAEFEIADHASAGLVGDLVDNFKLNGLSLTHLPRTLQPLELSLVSRGARPGTVILDREGQEKWLKSLPISASSANLNALVYKTMWTTDSSISASMSTTLVRSPEADATHVVGLAGAEELAKMMQKVLPPGNSHPFSSPDEQKAVAEKSAMEQMLLQMQAQIAKLMSQVPQQQAVSATNAPMQIDQPPQDPFIRAADLVVHPTRGLASQEEKAEVVRNINAAHTALQSEKQKNLSAQEELAKLRKEKEDADKKFEDQKRQNQELSNTYLHIINKTLPVDSQTIDELKKAADMGDVNQMNRSAGDLMVAASQRNQLMQQQLAAYQAAQQQQQQQLALNQTQNASMLEYNQLKQNVMAAGGQTGYVQPVSASSYLYQHNPVNTMIPPINSIANSYYRNSEIEASNRLVLKQNDGKNDGYISSHGDAWKAKPYRPGSYIEQVLNDTSIYNGSGSTEKAYSKNHLLFAANKLMEETSQFRQLDQSMFNN